MCDPVTALVGGAILGAATKGGGGGAKAPAASTTKTDTAVKTAVSNTATAPTPTTNTPTAPSEAAQAPAAALPNPASFGNAQYDRASQMTGRENVIVSLLSGAAGTNEAQAGGSISDAMKDNSFRRKLRNRGGLSLASGPLGSGDTSKTGTGINFNG